MPLGYYSGSYTNTIVLRPIYPLVTVTATGVVNVNSATAAGAGIYGGPGTTWAVTNQGSVESVGNLGIAISLQSGSTIDNAANAIIEGTGCGIEVNGGAGTVSNLGSITQTGAAGTNAILLPAGGFVTNAGIISAKSSTDPTIDLQAQGTVTNSGTISGASGTAIQFDGSGSNLLVLDPGYKLNGLARGSTSAGTTNTLELASAASVGTLATAIQSEFLNFGIIRIDNNAQWVLSGADTIGSGMTLSNAGTLTISGALVFDPSTMINSGSVSGTVTLTNGSYLHNTATGTIVAAGTAVYGTTSPNTVINVGSIKGGSAGVAFTVGGSVTNQSSGRITGGVGVDIAGGSGTLLNNGTINSIGPNYGVYLGKGGSVTNGPGALISGTYNGVLIRRVGGTVINSGTITSTDLGAVSLHAGGNVINNSGGMLSGDQGVDIRYGAGNVVNSGKVQGSTGAAGIWLSQVGGGVTNNSGGMISGRDGVEIVNGAIGTVINAGTISGIVHAAKVAGIYMTRGGQVVNDPGGIITGEYGVYIQSYLSTERGTVTNSGSISGNGGVAGVVIFGGGFVTNGVGGVINGVGADGIDFTVKPGLAPTVGTVFNTGLVTATGIGVVLEDGGTVVDAGTIAGVGTAVAFGGNSNNRLVLYPGYELTGLAAGSVSAGSTNTLELGSAVAVGTLSGLGSKFLNFGNVVVDGGSRWVLSGVNTVFSGVTLIDHGTLSVSGSLVNNGTVIVSGREEILNGGGVNAATVVSGGFEIVSSGGASADTTVSSGGAQLIEPYGRTTGAVVLGGGSETISGTAIATGVFSGGIEYVALGGVASASVVSGGGSAVVSSGGAVADGVIGGSGALLDLSSGAVVSGGITFADAGARLEIDDTTLPTNTISGLLPGDLIDLAGIAFNSSASVKLAADNVLQVNDGGTLYSLNLDPAQNFAGDSFQLSADDSGGTLISVSATVSLAFALGNFAVGAGGWTSQDAYPRALGDVNGDGLGDIVGFASNGTYVSYATGGGKFSNPILASAAFGANNGWTSDNTYPREVADVNGDGKDDLVGFGAGGVYVALSNGDGTFAGPMLASPDFGTGEGWTSQDQYPRELADVTGNGRADIVAFGADGVYVSLANADGTFGAPFLASSGFGTDNGWTSQDAYPRMLADLTGNGRDDIVGFGSDGIYVALANADGTFGTPFLASPSLGTDNGWTSQDTYPRELADINGDGKADIVAFAADGVYSALGNGDGTFQAPVFDFSDLGASPSAGGWTSQNIYPRLTGDVTGDHKADIVAFASDGTYVGDAALIFHTT